MWELNWRKGMGRSQTGEGGKTVLWGCSSEVTNLVSPKASWEPRLKVLGAWWVVECGETRPLSRLTHRCWPGVSCHLRGRRPVSPAGHSVVLYPPALAFPFWFCKHVPISSEVSTSALDPSSVPTPQRLSPRLCSRLSHSVWRNTQTIWSSYHWGWDWVTSRNFHFCLIYIKKNFNKHINRWF